LTSPPATTFYASFNKGLSADYAKGDPAAVGTKGGNVIVVFTKNTEGNRGVQKPRTVQTGEALDLSHPDGNVMGLSYPSEGNFNPSSGTFQCWVYPLFDPVLKTQDEHRNLFYIKTAGGIWNSIYLRIRNFYYGPDKKPVTTLFHFCINDGKSRLIEAWVNNLNFKKEMWHHVLAQWDSSSMAIYLDGVLKNSLKFEDDPYTASETAGDLIIGEAWLLDNKTPSTNFPMYIDEIKIDDQPLVQGKEFNPWAQYSIQKGVSALSAYRPHLPCPKISFKPRIDADLSDAAWSNAPALSGFTPLNAISSFRFSDVQTIVKSCHDKNNIYFAVIAFEPLMKTIKTQVREHDGKVWEDESIELLLCSDITKPKDYFHFIISAAGSRAELRGKQLDWNGSWQSAVRRGDGCWFFEIAIPFDIFDQFSPGTEQNLLFNVCRNRYISGADQSSLAIVGQSFNLISQFGNLQFSKPFLDEEKLNSFFVTNTEIALQQRLDTIGHEIRIGESIPGQSIDTDLNRLSEIKKQTKLYQTILAGKMSIDEYAKIHTQSSLLENESRSLASKIYATAGKKLLNNPSSDLIRLGEKTVYYILPGSGALLGIKQGNKVISSFMIDFFSFEPRVGAELHIDERADLVEPSSMRITQNRVEVICRNPSLQEVKIRKTYELIEEGIIKKKVTFSKETGQDFLISGATRMVIDPFIRGGGLYGRLPTPLNSPDETVFVPADDINAQRPEMKMRVYTREEGDAFAWIVDKTRSFGLAQYQLSINNRFVFPPAGIEQSYFTTEGWKLSWFAGILKNKIPASTEMCYHVFEGNWVKMNLDYMRISGFTAAQNGWKPFEQLGRLRWIDPIMWSTPLDFFNVEFPSRVKKLYEMMSKAGRASDIYLNLMNISYRWGDFPDSDVSTVTRSFTNVSFTEPALGFKKAVDIAINKKIMTGMYVWPWSLCESSGLPSSRPDWFFHDKFGNMLLDSAPFSADIGQKLYQHNYGAKGMLDEYLSRFFRMIDYFGFNMVYNDGTVNAPMIDWKTMQMYDQADGLLFTKRMSEETHKRKSLYFANSGGWRYIPHMDICWLESTPTIMDRPGVPWQCEAGAFMLCKLFAPPEAILPMLYWDHAFPKNNYINLAILFGIYPGRPRKGAEPYWTTELADPYNQAAMEMYGFGLTQVGLRPCFWLENTDIEAYAFRRSQDDGLLLTFCSHYSTNTTIVFSFNTINVWKNQETEKKEQLYVWYNNVKPPQIYIKNPALGLINLQNITDSVKTAGKNAEITIRDIEPHTAKQIYVSKNPMFVWSIENRRTLICTSFISDVHIFCKSENKYVINAGRPAVIFMAAQPKSVYVNGKSAKIQQEKEPAGITFGVSSGTHTVTIE